MNRWLQRSRGFGPWPSEQLRATGSIGGWVGRWGPGPAFDLRVGPPSGRPSSSQNLASQPPHPSPPPSIPTHRPAAAAGFIDGKTGGVSQSWGATPLRLGRFCVGRRGSPYKIIFAKNHFLRSNICATPPAPKGSGGYMKKRRQQPAGESRCAGVFLLSP